MLFYISEIALRSKLCHYMASKNTSQENNKKILFYDI